MMATVMTQNVYNGVDNELSAVAAATGFPDLPQKVAAVYQAYFARDFPARAAAIAALDPRIDFVLFRGTFGVRGAQTVADQLADRTPSGLWPSDHAGVVVVLELPRP